jgi:type VI secretion system protein ImpM
MNSMRSPPGFYGKLPILGDFVSRRLPGHFVQAWDAWLQEALSASREQLGSGWLNVYLTSPIWRFALSPGICGTYSWAGILMPSVDKVGRYFPLTLAVSIEQKDLLPWLFFAGADWFRKLERLALSVLEDRFDLDEFDRELRIQVLEPFLPRGNADFAACELNEKSRQMIFQIGMSELAQIREAFVHLSACLLGKFLPDYSLWCTSGSEKVKPSLLAYNGLPPPGVFAKFLAGQTQHGGWNRWSVPGIPIPDSDRNATDIAKGPDETSRVNTIHWRSAARSAVGNIRKINEDAHIERSDIGLWAVADGMGGHEAGDVASKTVVAALSAVPGNDSLESLIEEVAASLAKVNSDLLNMGKEFGPGHVVGSTVVVMLANGKRCAAVWAGDSRLYCCRDGNLEQITRDHSLVAEMSRLGVGSQDGLPDDSVSNVLTRALGAERDLVIDTVSYEARENDVYLLCSDGLVRDVGPGEISDILSKGDCDQSAQELIDLTLSREARDNVTVVVVCAGCDGLHPIQRK